MKSWQTKTLSEICEIERGGSPRPIDSYLTDSPDGINWIKIGDTKNVNKYITKTAEKILPEGAKRSRMVYEGDFILSNSMSFGRPYIMQTTGCIHDGWLVLRQPKLDQNYLYHVLSSDFVFRQFDRLAAGSTVRNLNIGLVKGVKIPFPPLPEQKRMVVRIESLTSRSQKLRELNASLVEDMTRLLRAEYKRITEDAPTKPFSDVAKLVRRWVKTKPDQNYPETGIRSFGKGTFHKPALTGEQLGTKRICRIKAGDLVFMNVFAWEGAIAVAQPEDDGRVASHRFMMHEILPDQATAEFLCYYFLTERGLEQIRGASPGSAGRNRTLGITKLERIPVPVPPIEDQRRFAKLRKLHFQLQRLHKEAEAELASFTPALLAKAFRGEL